MVAAGTSSMPLRMFTTRAMLKPLSPPGQAAAQVDVVDRVPVEGRDLVEGGPHDRGGEVVGAQVLQRPLAGAADGGAGGGDDDGLGHAFTLDGLGQPPHQPPERPR